MYELRDGRWHQAAKLAPDDLHDLFLFGATLKATERWLVVGAPGGTFLDAGTDDRGAFYVMKQGKTPPVAEDDVAATPEASPFSSTCLPTTAIPMPTPSPSPSLPRRSTAPPPSTRAA